jgi:uncharacterized membrane protein
VKALGPIFTVLYPFVIFLGLRWLSPRTLAALVGTALLIRALVKFRRGAWQRLSPLLGAAALIGGLIGLAALFDDGRYFKVLPVVINVGFFLAFARTLVHGMPMVESFARLHHAQLPDGGVEYCRRVTAVWALFFALNAGFILWLAFTASVEAWTLYTGLLAYLLAAALFVGETLYRAWRFRYYEDGTVDMILRRIFPPRVSA